MPQEFDYGKYVYEIPPLSTAIYQANHERLAALDHTPHTTTSRNEAVLLFTAQWKAAVAAFKAPHEAIQLEKAGKFRSDIEAHLGLARLPQAGRDLAWHIAVEAVDSWWEADQASEQPSPISCRFAAIADELTNLAALVKIVRNDCARLLIAVCSESPFGAPDATNIRLMHKGDSRENTEEIQAD